MVAQFKELSSNFCLVPRLVAKVIAFRLSGTRVLALPVGPHVPFGGQIYKEPDEFEPGYWIREEEEDDF